VLGRREDAPRPSPDQMRATTARRLRETLAELGPTFIKLGQIGTSGERYTVPTASPSG